MVPTTIPTTATAAAVAAHKIGVECYKNDQIYAAIQHFTTAIGLDGTNHTYYSNRSYLYHEIKVWTSAIADARKVGITSM